MPHRLRLPAAVVAALVVAEAAVLLLRPKERYPVVPAEPRAYFSAAELERATDFRTGQLWLFGARTRARARASWSPPCGSLRATGRRPVLTGAATAVAITLTTTVAALPLRAASRQRAKDVGPGHAVVGRLGGRRGQVRGDRRRLRGGRRRAAGRRDAPLRARLVGAGRGAPWPGSRWSSPTSGRSCSTRCSTSSRRCPAGATRADVLELARKAGVEVGEVYEVDASRRTTAANAYVTGVGHTKRVVLYDTLLKDFTPGRDAARGRPRARPRALPATSRTACCGSRSSRRSGCSWSPAAASS